MKYLKKFENHAAYEAAKSGLILPNVSLCVNENDVHYNPYVEPVVAKFNVTSTSRPTKIGYNQYISGFSSIEIDGVEQPSVVSAYTFSTLGEHTVKYTLTDPTSIVVAAFKNCSSLTSINIPSGVTSIGINAFYECYSLTSINIPSGVTSIGSYAFYLCSSLTSCTIGNGVTTIGDDAFNGCSSLTSIDIPDSVTSIGDNGLRNCSGLTNCTIGSGVTSIGNYFLGSTTTTLERVTIKAITPPILGGNAFYYSTSNCLIYVPSGSVDTYKSATNWSTYASRIQAIP